MGAATPTADVEFDLERVRRLLEQQHPDLAALPLSLADEGWDNVTFRLGRDLALRMPRREAAAALIEHEQRWLRELAPRLPIDVPAPVRLGLPSSDYPYRWSVVPWFEGRTADVDELQASEAERFGDFLRALHREAPADAPRNPHRGVPLEQRRVVHEERMHRLAAATPLVSDAIRGIWARALEAPDDAPDTWIHGDLHPRNMLVNGGRLRAVIDWGDMAAGDAASDLASLWMCFETRASRDAVVAQRGGASDATLSRARGWAVLYGVILLETGLVDHPAHALMGERTLRRLADDPGA